MSWFYILLLSNGNYYVGSTRNLPDRLIRHQQGRNKYTSSYLPIKLVFSKEFDSYSNAKKAETHIKKLKSRQILQKIINKEFIW